MWHQGQPHSRQGISPPTNALRESRPAWRGGSFALPNWKPRYPQKVISGQRRRSMPDQNPALWVRTTLAKSFHPPRCVPHGSSRLRPTRPHSPPLPSAWKSSRSVRSDQASGSGSVAAHEGLRSLAISDSSPSTPPRFAHLSSLRFALSMAHAPSVS